MATPAHNAAELAIVQAAQRVLPGGGFGNLASDIAIREGRDSLSHDAAMARRFTELLREHGMTFFSVASSPRSSRIDPCPPARNHP